MNKKVYNSILLFTGFVLIGIIALQLLWLNNMSAIRKKELWSNTQQALYETVKHLEEGEEKELVLSHMEEIIPDSINNEKFGKIKVVVNNLDSIETINISKEWKGGNLKGVMVHDPANDGSRNHEVYAHRTITFSNKVETKTKNLDSVVQQMIIEMDGTLLTQRIKADSIRNLLIHQLHNKGIDVDFEFTILQGDSTIHKSEHYIPSSIAMTFETKLFPNDIFDKNLKLIMYYPVHASNGYLFSKMRSTLFLTGLFTLGILVAFYLTIRTIKKQKKLGDMKNDFINNITHEFKTPIATSSIAISALENDQVRNDAAKFGYYTGILKEENVKMNLQVEKVLQMAMMEKGNIEIDLQEVNVHEVILESIKGFDLLFRENQVSVNTSLNAPKFNVKADPFHLLHVFNNIIDNAIKYKNENCTLSINTEVKNKELWISFKDNGPGMNAEVMRNAFEKFYRGQKGDLHEVKGFGLGLSYAKSIVELSKGNIQLISSPGRGTEVMITLSLV